METMYSIEAWESRKPAKISFEEFKLKGGKVQSVKASFVKRTFFRDGLECKEKKTVRYDATGRCYGYAKTRYRSLDIHFN